MILHLLRPRYAWAIATVLLLANTTMASTVVRFDTVLGSFDVQLFDDVMPATVNNFLGYVNSDRYDGTVIHRNSDTQGRDFVIQGGGSSFFDPDPPDPQAVMQFEDVVKDPAINDEPGGGVAGPSNVRGTIAMAKSGPNTVTSQWFINQGDNSFLDNPNRNDGGFSAFGIVLGDGMTVVDAIGDLPLPFDFGFSLPSPYQDLPLRNFSGSGIEDIRVANTVTVNSITQLNATPGDFNLDGTVDHDDLDLFNVGYGLATGAFVDDGDADTDNDVDGFDFLSWQRNLGATSGLGSSLAIVPEPSTLLLAAIGMLTLLYRR